MVPHLAELSTKLFQLLFSPPVPPESRVYYFSFQESLDQKPTPKNKLQPKFDPVRLVKSMTLALNNPKKPMKFARLFRSLK